FAVPGNRHPIRGSVLSRLCAGRNLPHIDLLGVWIEADDLIASDITKPHGSIRMDSHGIPGSVTILELRQGEDVESFRSDVVVQETAIRAAIDEPEFVVWTSYNSI